VVNFFNVPDSIIKEKQKAIIVSAPSGAGKTTIVKHLLGVFPQLEFSVSACSRPKRENETDGKDYYFISADEFRARIAKGDFVEWEEVYPDSYYGTLKSEVERIWNKGNTVIFDVDVIGGLNLKKYFGGKSLAVFVQPPSFDSMKKRLIDRNTESADSLEKRLSKAEYELTFANKFDWILVNNELDQACKEAAQTIEGFIK
jgi:guanylate kinase